MPTKHFEHITPIKDKPVTPQLSERDTHVEVVEVVEDKGRMLKRVRAVATFPVTVIAGQTILATWGNAARAPC